MIYLHDTLNLPKGTATRILREYREAKAAEDMADREAAKAQQLAPWAVIPDAAPDLSPRRFIRGMYAVGLYLGNALEPQVMAELTRAPSALAMTGYPKQFLITPDASLIERLRAMEVPVPSGYRTPLMINLLTPAEQEAQLALAGLD